LLQKDNIATKDPNWEVLYQQYIEWHLHNNICCIIPIPLNFWFSKKKDNLFYWFLQTKTKSDQKGCTKDNNKRETEMKAWESNTNTWNMEEGEVTPQTLGRKQGYEIKNLFIFVLILFIRNILLIIIKENVFFFLLIIQISSLIFVTTGCRYTYNRFSISRGVCHLWYGTVHSTCYKYLFEIIFFLIYTAGINLFSSKMYEQCKFFYKVITSSKIISKIIKFIIIVESYMKLTFH